MIYCGNCGAVAAVPRSSAPRHSGRPVHGGRLAMEPRHLHALPSLPPEPKPAPVRRQRRDPLRELVALCCDAVAFVAAIVLGIAGIVEQEWLWAAISFVLALPFGIALVRGAR